MAWYKQLELRYFSRCSVFSCQTEGPGCCGDVHRHLPHAAAEALVADEHPWFLLRFFSLIWRLSKGCKFSKVKYEELKPFKTPSGQMWDLLYLLLKDFRIYSNHLQYV